MKDVRRAMTDAELHRLENENELSRCEELRLQIVRDELAGRQSEYRPPVNM